MGRRKSGDAERTVLIVVRPGFFDCLELTHAFFSSLFTQQK